ncbi:MAG: response regulator [Bdellovibrionota bacterium]
MPGTSKLKPNILAVDDYGANLVALQAVLGNDYNLILANSGTEAISILLTRTDFDVILMDIQMPEMDGYETATEIKKITAVQDIPIIFITAVYKEDPFVKKGYEVGGVDYFSKPFDPDILKLKIAVYSSFRQKADILKARERQIRDTEELLRTGRKLSSALESLPVGVLISDVEGRICQINEQVAHICNSTKLTDTNSYGEMLGWWDHEGKIIKDTNVPLHKAIHEGISTHSATIEISCADKTSKQVLCSASPLLGLDGHIVGAVVVLQDVTGTKKIEEDLENRITKLVSLGVKLEESHLA